MKKNTILKITNPVLLILVISQVLSGMFAMKLNGEQFEIIHKGGGMILLALVIFHLILNFNWIKASYFKK
jgi:heme A synthase